MKKYATLKLAVTAIAVLGGSAVIGAAQAFPSCLAVPASISGVSGAVCTGALTAAIPVCTTLWPVDFGTTCGLAVSTAALSCGVSVSSIVAMIAACL